MNTDELREELERLGRQPVPAPRPDFVEGLLTRIQLSEDLPVPAPILLTPRQPWARFRMVAAGAVAAALLLAVGLFSLFQGGNPSSGGQLLTYQGQSVGAKSTSRTLSVAPDGRVTMVDSNEPVTGTYQAECKDDARIVDVQGASLTCSKGERVELTVANGRVTSIVALPGTSTSEVAGSPTTTAPASTTTTAAPTTTASAAPAAAPSTSPAIASVQPATTTSGTTSSTRPTPSGPSGVTTSTAAPVSFQLAQVTGQPDGVVTFTWPASTDPAFGNYLVLRTTSSDPKVDPETPWYVSPQDAAPVQATLARDKTSYTATFDGTDVPVGTPQVWYRVAVVDPQGRLLALSSTLTLKLEWTLKPSGESDSAPTTSTTGAPTPPTPSTTAHPAPAGGAGGTTPSGRTAPPAGG